MVEVMTLAEAGVVHDEAPTETCVVVFFVAEIGNEGMRSICSRDAVAGSSFESVLGASES